MINHPYPIISVGDVFDEEMNLKKSDAEWSRMKTMVYWIQSLDHRPIYIGSTKIGIRQRLVAHVTQQTRLGQFIKVLTPASLRWPIHLYPADSLGDARAIEAECIRQAFPALNSYGTEWNVSANQLVMDLVRWNGEAPPIELNTELPKQ